MTGALFSFCLRRGRTTRNKSTVLAESGRAVDRVQERTLGGYPGSQRWPMMKTVNGEGRWKSFTTRLQSMPMTSCYWLLYCHVFLLLYVNITKHFSRNNVIRIMVSDRVGWFPSVVIMLVHLTLNFWPMRIQEDFLILTDTYSNE